MKDEHNDDFDGYESYNATIIVCVAGSILCLGCEENSAAVQDKEERVSKPLSLPDALFSSLTQNTHERLFLCWLLAKAAEKIVTATWNEFFGSARHR